MSRLEDLSVVLVAHAHPDDETLATGGLLSWLGQQGVVTAVVTATRGECGEVVPGSSSAQEGSPELAVVREGELARALKELGVHHHAFLGTDPARVAGAASRIYRDSGMQWIRPGLAGPADATDQSAFAVVSIDEAVDDLVAFVKHLGAEAIVSYEADGGYGHPDHVRMHQVARAAATATGIQFAEIVPTPQPQDSSVHWYSLDSERRAVEAALRSHATQLTVVGDEVEHVGGQRHPIGMSVGIRLK